MNWSVILSALLCIQEIQGFAQTCSPPASGLVGWWSGNGDATDRISGSVASLSGDETYGPGKVGQGFFSPTGTSGLIVTNTTALKTADLTIETWIQRSSATTVSPGSGGVAVIVAWVNGYYFWMDAQGYLQFNSTSDSNIIRSATNISDTSFHHIALTLSEGSLDFYVDGEDAGGAYYPVSFPYAGNVGIGYRSDNADNSFWGTIDELKIYDRALTIYEIRAIFNAGSAGNCYYDTPVIIDPPVSKTVFVGSPASFSVLAVGSSPIYYQWTLNGTNLAGATNTSFTLPEAQFSDAGNYAVILSNSFGTTVSTNATLAVIPLPACVPLSAGILGWWRGEGNAADVFGLANGTLVGQETYGQAVVGSGFLGDGNGSGVIISNLSGLQAQAFSVEAWVARASASKVSNGSGGNGVICGFGGGGYLIYLDGFGRLIFGSPVFTSSQVISDTNFHHIAVTYDGAMMAMYIDGQSVSSGPLQGSFTYPNPFGIGCRPDNLDNGFLGTIDDLALYNRALAATEVKAIFNDGPSGKCVDGPPIITVQPTNQTVFAGQNVLWNTQSLSTSPQSYQWFFNGTNAIAGATNALLLLSDVQPTQSGNYALLVSNSFGSVLSSNAVLTVNPPPPCVPLSAGILGWWRGEGNAADAFGLANGTLVGQETYGQAVVGSGFLGDGNGSGVIVSNLSGLQAQVFSVEAWVARGRTDKVSNGSGGNGVICGFGGGGYFIFLDSSGRLTFGSPAFTSTHTQLISDINFHHIAVTYDGTTMVMYIDGQSVSSGPLQGSFTYSTPFGIGCRPDNLDNGFLGTIDDLALYNRVLAASDVKAIFNSGPIGKCVDGPPIIAIQPTNQTVFAGQNVLWNTQSLSTSPQSYQWFLNGTNAIAGATNANLLLSDIQPAQSGNYDLLVSNSFGSAFSSNAVLTVNPPPPCVPLAAGILGWWRGEGNATDAFGLANGTLVGQETYGQAVVGSGFLGDGNGSGVIISNLSGLPAQAFSVEAWVARASASKVSNGSGGNGIICGFGASGYLIYFDGSGRLTFGSPVFTSTQVISDTNFHHIAVTYDGTTMVMYIDGQSVSSGSLQGSFTYSTPFAIGCRSDNLDNSFLGTIDDLALYNRALGAQEVTAIFNGGPTGKCVDGPPAIAVQPNNQTVLAGQIVLWSTQSLSTSRSLINGSLMAQMR